MKKYKVVFLDDVIDGNHVCSIYMESENYKLVDQISFAYCEEMNRRGKPLYRAIYDITNGDVPEKKSNNDVI